MSAIEQRFWANVDKSGDCWLWTRSTNPPGWYGQFYLRKEKQRSVSVHAHRWIWEQIHGPIPEGLCVLHRCDVPACVNPSHLFLGSQKENMQDAFRKGRVDRGPRWYAKNFAAQRRRREKGTSTWARGEDVGNHKLSESDVLKIRGMEGSAPSTEIAPLFGLHSSTIRGIWHRKTWAHLTLIAACFLSACARTDIFFPPDGKSFVEGSKAPSYHRAVVLNGSDSLGNTQIEVTSNSVRYASAGGIDNSTTSKEGYRTIRHGVGTAATAAVLGIGLSQAASAYGANQAQVATSSAAASKAAAATAASKGATTVRLAEIAAQKEAAQAAANAAAAAASKALPAAGSTIPATIPATVVPVP